MSTSALLAYAIRWLSLVYSGLVVMAASMLTLLGLSVPGEYAPTTSDYLFFPLTACIVQSGFIYIALSGRRLAGSRIRRAAGGVLLAIPLGLGGWGVVIAQHDMRSVGLFFLLPAALLFVCAIWPLQLTSRYNPE